MSVMLFVIVLAASFIVVRIGAIAFQLTGLEWSLAKFQSLSCFSGTGFTTKEAELITGDGRRRRIASVLMVLGNAGLVTLIATVASALNPENTILGWLSKSFFPDLPFGLVRWVNMGMIVLVIFVAYKLFTNKVFTNKLTDYLKKKVLRRDFFKPMPFEELLLMTGGYGVTRVEISKDSELIEKTLAESELRKNDITVLAIIRRDDTLPNPSAETKILKGDELFVFGNMNNIHQKMKL
jgi:hypothetical protein